jgi:hypothetical protein
MISHDITKTNIAIERLLETTTNPHHRFLDQRQAFSWCSMLPALGSALAQQGPVESRADAAKSNRMLMC